MIGNYSKVEFCRRQEDFVEIVCVSDERGSCVGREVDTVAIRWPNRPEPHPRKHKSLFRQEKRTKTFITLVFLMDQGTSYR